MLGRYHSRVSNQFYLMCDYNILIHLEYYLPICPNGSLEIHANHKFHARSLSTDQGESEPLYTPPSTSYIATISENALDYRTEKCSRETTIMSASSLSHVLPYDA